MRCWAKTSLSEHGFHRKKREDELVSERNDDERKEGRNTITNIMPIDLKDAGNE